MSSIFGASLITVLVRWSCFRTSLLTLSTRLVQPTLLMACFRTLDRQFAAAIPARLSRTRTMTTLARCRLSTLKTLMLLPSTASTIRTSKQLAVIHRQANRLGKWTLLSEQDLYETCNFAIGIDSGIVVRPGMVVDIADPLRGGTRRNGRVSSATTLQID